MLSISGRMNRPAPPINRPSVDEAGFPDLSGLPGAVTWPAGYPGQAKKPLFILEMGVDRLGHFLD
jgi:hypothetical protein